MSRIFVLAGLTCFSLLAGCAPGRWVVKDLSSYSYEFGPVAASKPFAPKDAKRFQAPPRHADSYVRRQHTVRPVQ